MKVKRIVTNIAAASPPEAESFYKAMFGWGDFWAGRCDVSQMDKDL